MTVLCSVPTYATLKVGDATGSQRAHIILPQELVKEIDDLVGPRGRSAFLVETAKAELRKRKLLEFLSDPEPAWKDEDHPELADGTYAWVRSLREEGNARLRRIEEREQALEREKQPG